MNTFLEQVAKHRPGLAVHPTPIRVLALDPGETTGYAIFRGVELLEVGQLKTTMMPLAAVRISEFLTEVFPDKLVIEDYRVYKWKTDSHAWAELHTPRLIGAVEYIAHTRSLPMVKQSAQVGKGFCTDDRLKEWGFYKPALRHGNDATRHACQYLMFGAEF
jgi:hypothetical protein